MRKDMVPRSKCKLPRDFKTNAILEGIARLNLRACVGYTVTRDQTKQTVMRRRPLGSGEFVELFSSRRLSFGAMSSPNEQSGKVAATTRGG